MAESVLGVKELLRKFEQLKTAGKEKALRAAVRGAANVVVKEAKARIPVGSIPHRVGGRKALKAKRNRAAREAKQGVLVSPGFARRSIVARTYTDKKTGRVGAVIGVRALAFYAVQFVEMERGKSKVKGRPWLRPAFEASESRMISEFHRAFQRVIQRLKTK